MTKDWIWNPNQNWMHVSTQTLFVFQIVSNITKNISLSVGASDNIYSIWGVSCIHAYPAVAPLWHLLVAMHKLQWNKLKHFRSNSEKIKMQKEWFFSLIYLNDLNIYIYKNYANSSCYIAHFKHGFWTPQLQLMNFLCYLADES